MVLGVPLPSTDLEIASAAYERQISDLVAEDERTAEFVEELETHYDSQDAQDEFIEDAYIGATAPTWQASPTTRSRWLPRSRTSCATTRAAARRLPAGRLRPTEGHGVHRT